MYGLRLCGQKEGSFSGRQWRRRRDTAAETSYVPPVPVSGWLSPQPLQAEDDLHAARWRELTISDSPAVSTASFKPLVTLESSRSATANFASYSLYAGSMASNIRLFARFQAGRSGCRDGVRRLRCVKSILAVPKPGMRIGLPNHQGLCNWLIVPIE